ncbi:MAG TPA: hypothetical protein P5079_00290 [Elusimicrobiota bacterium]|nr:hypothetical protein [Elusimicrobiota bacterium]
MKLFLDFYGVRAAIESEAESILEEFRRDFQWFRADPEKSMPHVRLGLSATLPPSAVPQKKNSRRFVHHDPEAVVDYDFSEEEGGVFCAEPHRLHELGYLLLLSRVGEMLDRRGLHRVHGLALEWGGKCALMLLPMGGGKTTFALEALRSFPVRLVSEDTPLVDEQGRLWPFPLRVGICGDRNIDGIPESMQRVFRRKEYGPKMLVDIDYWKGRIAVGGPFVPSAIFVGQRGWAAPGEKLLRRVAAWRAAPALISSLLVGVGVPQGREYLLRWDVRATGGLLKNAFSRTRTMMRLLACRRVYLWRLSRDTVANAKTVSVTMETFEDA